MRQGEPDISECAPRRAVARAGKAGAVGRIAPLLASCLLCAAIAGVASAGGDGNLVVYGVPANEVPAFFQSHRVVIGRVGQLERKQDGVMLTIDYPSANFGGEGGGSTVLYSHRIRVLESGSPAHGLETIDLDSAALVLVQDDADRFVYRLVGYMRPGVDNGQLPWDFFADKPHLIFARSNASR